MGYNIIQYGRAAIAIDRPEAVNSPEHSAFSLKRFQNQPSFELVSYLVLDKNLYFLHYTYMYYHVLPGTTKYECANLNP